MQIVYNHYLFNTGYLTVLGKTPLLMVQKIAWVYKIANSKIEVKLYFNNEMLNSISAVIPVKNKSSVNACQINLLY